MDLPYRKKLADTKLLLEGSDSGRRQLDNSGNSRGYDGKDILRPARQRGGENARLIKLELYSSELSAWVQAQQQDRPHW